MNYRYILATAITAMACQVINAQDIYTRALNEIERNNTLISLHRSAYEANAAECRTSLTPANPEIEFGYLWGGVETGNRKDVSITQELDFPTVYSRRRSLSRQQSRSAEQQFKAQRLEVLLQAKELLIEQVYSNAMLKIMQQQAADADSVLAFCRKLHAAGQITRLDLNKAMLDQADAANAMSQAQLQCRQNAEKLTAFNGGKALKFEADTFPSDTLPSNFNQWFETALEQYPALEHFRRQIDVERHGVSLAKAEGLPKIAVGYMGEFVRGSNFQGVTVGLSIPLWENRNKVSAAKARQAVAIQTLADAQQEYYSTLRSLYDQAETLEQMEQRYALTLRQADNTALLRTSLNKGQITLLQYINEKRYMLEAHQILLETRRDRQLALCRLTAFAL